jgi:hypothetical protein
MGKKIYSRCHLAMLEKVEPPSAPASWTEKVEAVKDIKAITAVLPTIQDT